MIDWARPGKVRQVSSVEAAAEELLKWPKTKKRDKAATLLADAMTGMADMEGIYVRGQLPSEDRLGRLHQPLKRGRIAFQTNKTIQELLLLFGDADRVYSTYRCC